LEISGSKNIFARILGHSTVHLDHKDLLELEEFKYLGLEVLKDLELRKLLNFF
jgi:hypothetical protein